MPSSSISLKQGCQALPLVVSFGQPSAFWFGREEHKQCEPVCKIYSLNKFSQKSLHKYLRMRTTAQAHAEHLLCFSKFIITLLGLKDCIEKLARCYAMFITPSGTEM